MSSLTLIKILPMSAVVAKVHWLEDFLKVLDFLTRRRVFNQNLTILAKVFNVRRSKNKKGLYFSDFKCNINGDGHFCS